MHVTGDVYRNYDFSMQVGGDVKGGEQASGYALVG